MWFLFFTAFHAAKFEARFRSNLPELGLVVGWVVKRAMMALRWYIGPAAKVIRGWGFAFKGGGLGVMVFSYL